MDYEKLDRESFDAIVTGEMTHYALWFEEQLEFFVAAFFLNDPRVVALFGTTFLRSRDFSLHRKLEFAKVVLKGWADDRSAEFLQVVGDVEKLIAIRNAMAHGTDVGGDGLELLVEILSYGGKTRQIAITPDSHRVTLATAEHCLEKLKELKYLGSAVRNQLDTSDRA